MHAIGRSNSTDDGALAIADYLLTFNNFNYNFVHHYGQTALTSACAKGFEKTVDRLLKIPDIKLTRENTINMPASPLEAAIMHGHMSIAKKVCSRMPPEAIQEVATKFEKLKERAASRNSSLQPLYRNETERRRSELKSNEETESRQTHKNRNGR